MQRYTPHLTTLQKRRVRHAKFIDSMQSLLLLFVWIILLLCALNDNIPLGETTVGVFAISSLILRIGSNRIFTLALATFIVIPVSAMLSPYTDTAENMAIFSFLLLVIGVGYSLLELLTNSKRRKHRN